MKRKLDRENRLVIPAEMRKELGLENGSQVNMEIENNKLIITNPKEVDYKGRIDKAIKELEYMFQNEPSNSSEYDYHIIKLKKILEGDK